MSDAPKSSTDTARAPAFDRQPTRWVRHRTAWAKGVSGFVNNECFSAAGNLAFLAMLSLFPFVIFLVSVSGFLGQSARGEEAIAFALEAIPPEVSGFLSGPIMGIVQNADTQLLTGSVLVTLWTASAGIEAARSVLLRAFGWHHASVIWLRRLESLALVIFAALSLIVSMSILVLGPAVRVAAADLFPEEAVEPLELLLQRLGLLVSPMLLLGGIYGSFLALTPRRVKGARRMPGAIVTLLFFAASARGLSLYLSYAGSYDVTYGSLAGVVVTQLFCYLLALGFAFGAELNAGYTAVFAPGSLDIDKSGDPDGAD